jgi:hypothetical protein
VAGGEKKTERDEKIGIASFRGASKTRTRNLEIECYNVEIPGSTLRVAPE